MPLAHWRKLARSLDMVQLKFKPLVFSRAHIHAHTLFSHQPDDHKEEMLMLTDM